jgi:phage gp36-like protein
MTEKLMFENPAARDAALVTANARTRTAEAYLRVHTSRVQRGLENAKAGYDAAMDELNAAQAAEAEVVEAGNLRDLSGVRLGLSDSMGNFAPNVAVATSGGIGVEASNTIQNGTEQANRASEAGTYVGGVGGNTGNIQAEIPENFESLTWPELRSLSANFDSGVRTKDDALAAIRKELERRDAKMGTADTVAGAADIVEIYGPKQLRNVAPLDDNDTIISASVAGALNRASSTVDSYLSRRYAVPLASAQVTADIQQKTIDIAMYTMALGLDQQTTEHRLRYEDAIAWLRDVAAGKAGIGNDAVDEKPIVNPDRTTTSGFLDRV